MSNYNIEYKMKQMKYNMEKRNIEIKKFKQNQKINYQEIEKIKKELKLKEKEDTNNRKKVEMIKLRSEKIKRKNDKIEFKQNNYKQQINNMYFKHFIDLNGVDFDAINNNNLTINIVLAHFYKIEFDFKNAMKPVLTETIDCKAYIMTYEYFKKMNNYEINNYLLYYLDSPKTRCSIIINNFKKINNEMNFIGYFDNNDKITWFDYRTDDLNIKSNKKNHVYMCCELKKNKSCFCHNKI
jgi:hypothetical protein